MPLNLNREVFITCAVTGSGSTQDRSQLVPRSPKDIADSAIDAAKAGAAIVHCHVRDPETGKPSRNLAYYREVTDRIRDADVDVVLNLTAGMGGDIVFGGTENPLPVAEGTDMIGAEERVAHIIECLPEICTLDCGIFIIHQLNSIVGVWCRIDLKCAINDGIVSWSTCFVRTFRSNCGKLKRTNQF